MSAVVGIDLSSKAIDLVRLDENAPRADWLHVEISGRTAWDRIRTIPDVLPSSSWWDDVFLVALERPFVRHGQDVIRLAQGAVLASVPRSVEAWEVSPSQWKNALGIPMREKPAPAAFCPFEFRGRTEWSQDARDALGVALYARDTNARGILARLTGSAA